MTQEPLEGVLSETLLDELASDLGIDPTILRAHPIFRVLKGMVMLTYPLKSYAFPEFKSILASEVNPTEDVWIEVLDYLGKGAFYSASINTNDGATALYRKLKITLDDVVVELTSDTLADNGYFMVANLRGVTVALLKEDHMMNIGFKKRLKVEMQTTETLVAGKYLRTYVDYGEG